MYQLRKKITVWGLLLLVAAPLFFSVGIFVKQKIIQFHRKERLEKEILETIIVPVEKANWVKAGKEILVDGKLFDVKSFVREGKKISLTGFFDCKEDKLIEHLEDLNGQKNENGGLLAQLAVKFLFAPIYNESGYQPVQIPWQIIASKFSTYSEVTLTGFPPADTPPPRNC